MDAGMLFWILMILWFLFGLFWHRAEFGTGNYGFFGGSVLLFILLALLGWKVFGPPIK